MENELVKQLRDAGFPLIEMVGKPAYYSDDGYNISCLFCGKPIVLIEGKYYLRPALEELIHAVDDLKFTILHDKDGWYAENVAGMSPSDCKSPEEAVGRLFLSINPH